MTPKECAVCGHLDVKARPATILDRSGGSLTHTCRECRERIRRRGRLFARDVCVFCASGDTADGKAETLHFHLERQGPRMNVCDDCRVQLVFENGAVGMEVVR